MLRIAAVPVSTAIGPPVPRAGWARLARRPWPTASPTTAGRTGIGRTAAGRGGVTFAGLAVGTDRPATATAAAAAPFARAVGARRTVTVVRRVVAAGLVGRRTLGRFAVPVSGVPPGGRRGFVGRPGCWRGAGSGRDRGIWRRDARGFGLVHGPRNDAHNGSREQARSAHFPSRVAPA
ncbi:MAG TPA: hypothetical protein VFZ65_08455 [Planctomycetota bacterium]|nr:hypothetical protein [Planctomycetota bacterium]